MCRCSTSGILALENSLVDGLTQQEGHADGNDV